MPALLPTYCRMVLFHAAPFLCWRLKTTRRESCRRPGVAQAQTSEIEQRADDLHTELDHAHASLTSATEELTAMRLAHKGEIADLHASLTRERQTVELQAAAVRSELAEAREEAAALRRKLDALVDQQMPEVK